MTEHYPRVLVVALGRINEQDLSNNGLLLRNLFGSSWPRDHLAQVFSSDDNGDRGFFGRYYALGANDRRFGRLFFRLKASTVERAHAVCNSGGRRALLPQMAQRFRYMLKKLFISTGIYELVFRPRLSPSLQTWVQAFAPDVILAQGYTLSFTWLPMALQRSTGARLAVLTSDDWPKYLYSGLLGEPAFFQWIVRPFVKAAALKLFRRADVPFAFGLPMAEEYSRRYGRNFITLNHGDNPNRFDACAVLRCHPKVIRSVVMTGSFNRFRSPLLQDVDAACRILTGQGLHVRVALISSTIPLEVKQTIEELRYVDLYDDPGNDLLPSYLAGADALILAEGFESGFVSAIELSISSKAHLFMFSNRPILVYGAGSAGVVKYAKAEGWARVVEHRSVLLLATSLRSLLEDCAASMMVIEKARTTAMRYHTHEVNQRCFREALAKSVLHSVKLNSASAS